MKLMPNGSVAYVNRVLRKSKPMGTLTVTGRGVENIQTTIAEVTLGVEIQGRTASEVQQSVRSRSSAVVALLQSRNVEKLKTTGVNFNPTYGYDKPELTGFMGTNLVSFRMSTEQVGILLDEVIVAGVTRIDSVNFIADDAATNEARQKALQKATHDAQNQASDILGTLNFTQREIVSIEVNAAGKLLFPDPVPRAIRARARRDEIIPIIGGEQQVEATVTLQISY